MVGPKGPFSYLPDTAGAPRQIPGWDPSINKRKRVGDPRVARWCGGELGRWDPLPVPSFRVLPHASLGANTSHLRMLDGT